MFEIIAKALPPAPTGGYTILEPGAGTGIFSRLVLSPPDGYVRLPISQLVGVEPSAGMRQAWDKAYAKIDPKSLLAKGSIVDGSFEDFSQSGVEKGSADLVAIAQAWHWCPDHESALVRFTFDSWSLTLS